MKTKKIAIVTISLKNGGLERSCANLSKLLTEAGYIIHLICLTPGTDYDFKGTLYMVRGEKSKSNMFIHRLYRFSKLRSYIKNQGFDYIIDSRTRLSSLKELYYLYYIYRKENIIYMVHSSKLDHYLPKQKWVTDKMIHKASHIITVSNGIRKAILSRYQINKCTRIYNYIQPLELKNDNTSKEYEYILFLGRIDDKVKNLTLLIDSYNKSNLPPDIKLLIVGSGPDSNIIVRKITELGLDDLIKLIPFTPHIANYLSGAKFLVLSSRYEGFGMVLAEALSVGTPVISVKCKYGPSEIVKHEINGLLVENNNLEALASAMDRMVQDKQLYQKCKLNAKNSIKHLSKEAIKEQWVNILQ